MKSTFKVVDIIYGVLSNDADLIATITGSVYKKRPVNSRLEDIDVACLPINNEQIQQAVVNVNAHVQNLTIVVNGIQDTTQPDTKRLKLITEKAIRLLDDKYIDDYWFTVQQQNIFSEDKEHYSNIRVNFYYENF
jgi:hypothetical protein